MSFAGESGSAIVWCCARDCKSNSKASPCSLFNLPSDNECSYVWLKNADRLDLLQQSYNLPNTVQICGAHFQEKMFTNANKNCLVSYAVPTIFDFESHNLGSSQTTQYAKMENSCIENQGVVIIGEVLKIDPFFEDNASDTETNNIEIISRNAEVETEAGLGTSTRTSTVISIVKHDTVVPVSGMESVFFKNNAKGITKIEDSPENDSPEEIEVNEENTDLDEEYSEDDNRNLKEDLCKNRKVTKKAKKTLQTPTRKSVRKRCKKRPLKYEDDFSSSREKPKLNLKHEIIDKNFVEFRRKDFFKICRICFNDDEHELLDINYSKCQGKTFASILESNKNYDPNNAYNISRFICKKCTAQLLQIQSFYLNLQISTTILMDAQRTLSECSSRKGIRISNWAPTVIKVEDCELEPFVESIKREDLNIIEIMERSDDDSDRYNKDPNDDSYWSDEDYDSLIKIKRETALKIADSTNDDSRDFINKIEVISERDDSSSDSDAPPRKRKYARRNFSSPRQVKARTRKNKPRLPRNYVPSTDDLTCPDCKKIFPTRASLGSHQRNVHVTVDCKVCGMKLKGASIRWHLRVMHSMVNGVEDREKAAPKKVLCVKCGKWVRAHKYKIHLKTHMLTKPYACEICDYRTSDKHRLIPHKLLHTGEKPHLCATCGEGFHRKDYLKVHVALHTPLDVPIICNTCPEGFGTKFEYHTHRRIVHGFQKVGALPRVRLINGQTVQTVQKTNTRSCHICHKVFPRNNKSFYVHMREHIPKPVRCSLCNKQCNSPEALKSHMRTHTGEKPFKCKLCDKAYSQYGHLQSHRATFHENKRAFKCEYCDKAFNLSIGLKEHIRIHTGETLDCEHCGKAFRQRSNFYKHLREVHSIRKRELNREQSAAQNAPGASNDSCLTVLTNALTD